MAVKWTFPTSPKDYEAEVQAFLGKITAPMQYDQAKIYVKKHGSADAAYAAWCTFQVAFYQKNGPNTLIHPLLTDAQTLRRVAERQDRREHGCTTAPVSKALDRSTSQVQMRGYTALQSVFPEAQPQALVSALADHAEAPADLRVAAAARQLIAESSKDASKAPAPTIVVVKPAPVAAAATLPRAATIAPRASAQTFQPPVRAISKEAKRLQWEAALLQAPVFGLQAWLEELGLGARAEAATQWAREQGACDLGELLENWEDLAGSALGLDAAALGKLREQAAAAAAKVGADVAAALASTALPERTITRTVTVMPVRPVLVKAVSMPAGAAAGSAPAASQPRLGAVPEASPRLPPSGGPAGAAATLDKAADEKFVAYRGKYVLTNTANVNEIHPQRTRARLQGVRGSTFRDATPPPRAEPLLLRAPIPSDAVLRAVEVARAEAKEAEGQVAGEQSPGEEAQERKSKRGLDTFDEVQQAFKQEHGQRIVSELGGNVKLVPTQLPTSVSARFVETVQETGNVPDFGYHGTQKHNFQGIFTQGLRIPGRGGVRTAHGATHGVGIYTARPGAAALSRGFCDSEDMLVCGLITDRKVHGTEEETPQATAAPVKVKATQHRNHRRPAPPAPPAAHPSATAGSSSAIRTVMDARIVFDEKLVAPLFVAKGGGLQPPVSSTSAAGFAPLPMQGPGGNTNTSGSDRAAKGQVLIKGTGEQVFLPPEPSNNKRDINVKRRVVRAAHDVDRRRARDAKARAAAGEQRD